MNESMRYATIINTIFERHGLPSIPLGETNFYEILHLNISDMSGMINDNYKTPEVITLNHDHIKETNALLEKRLNEILNNKDDITARLLNITYCEEEEETPSAPKESILKRLLKRLRG